MLDFDLIVIDTNLDTLERSLKRSPSWQKLLIFLNHGQVNGSNVWVDTDVIINTNSAYDITNEIPLEKVASVDQYGYSNKRNN
ncbi:hypothetical protein DIU36_30730 [Mucilaginibacter rubeus]|nr:hypothetical protein DIU36_30730 [Mucilaginibacter rubeus]